MSRCSNVGLFVANSAPMTLFRPKAVDVYVHDHVHDHDDDNDYVVVNVDVIVAVVGHLRHGKWQ
ncbi:MAG TPA: hypothetical protein VGL91_12885 [Acidobacteriota bacterium]